MCILAQPTVKPLKQMSYTEKGELSWCRLFMMTSSNGHIFCDTGHLCEEFTGHQWITLTKASDAELWCFLRMNKQWSKPWRRRWLRRHRVHYDVAVMRTTSSANSDKKVGIMTSLGLQWTLFLSNTQRNKRVIITSKRRFDVIFTRLLRFGFAGSITMSSH